MNNEKQNILVGILDWGIGHATRIIPVIKELHAQNFEVILASSGDAGTLIRDEFPKLEYEELPGYRPYYSNNKSMTWTMLKQLPKFYRTIQLEHNHLHKLISRHQIDVVLSDNRYGLWSENIPSVLITHQLKLQLPGSPIFPARIVHSVYNKLLSNFNELWIPDYETNLNLSGSLGHMQGKKATYIGPLSVMKFDKLPLLYDLAIVLSGPEPQRTKFEQLIRIQIQDIPGKIILVQGKPGKVANGSQRDNVTIEPFLSPVSLNKVLNQSKLVICRSGYSTIMDLVRLKKNAVLVPTPGQTEQEYLAKYLKEIGLFHFIDQDVFNAKDALIAALKVPKWNGFDSKVDLLKEAVSNLST